MPCNNCQCGKSTHPLQSLFDKLNAAKFTGTLELRLESGAIASAELRHYLANTEFLKPLPGIDDRVQQKEN